ncbi:MAG TPA: cytochrome P450 [Streptosporangiaceae bacterium]|jgi:cytochrome P450 family 142 subfamily A polypeptide 1|nr:cytochrome P450 [Streptosporangiaceae bacterium]
MPSSPPASAAPLNILDPYLYASDPSATYQWLRDDAPAYWDPVNEIWGISRYADVLAIERDAARYSSARGSRPLIEMSASMINRDDPRHSQQRKLVSGRFSPRTVRQHEERVRAAVAELVAAAAAKGTVEVVSELAAPLPAMVICELLGFDRAQWPKCMEWSERTMSSAGFRNDDPGQPTGSPEAIGEFVAAFGALLQARRADPRDDLASAWVHATVEGEPLDLPEIIQEGLLLLDGGAETTRSVIGQTVWNLARFPDQRRLLLADPSIIAATAVEEFIRYATPVLNMRRTVTADHELHGQRLRAGDQVLLMYGAANTDEREFANPGRFDVTRRPNHHLAFGFGPHFCLGAHLARLELRILFEELLSQLPGIRLLDDRQPEFAPGYFTRTLKELQVEFTPSP